MKVGQAVQPGEIFGEVVPDGRQLQPVHWLTVAPGIEGTVSSIAEAGSYTVVQELVVLVNSKGATVSLNMIQRWPIRKPRPFQCQRPRTDILLTGTRVLGNRFLIGRRSLPYQLWCDVCLSRSFRNALLLRISFPGERRRDCDCLDWLEGL